MKNTFSSYRALGLSVFPCRGKKPLITWKPFQTEFASDEQLAQWDKTQHNIAIATGKLSGVAVVDIDSDSIPLDNFPKTWTVKTSKGYHLYYRYPDFDIRNTTHLNGQPVDIRGEGGYVVAPPSTHPDGHIYHWVDGLSPEDLKPAEWPTKTTEKQPLTPTSSPKTRTTEATSSYISTAIDNELNILRNTGAGGRNDQLNRSSFALAQFIGHGVSESRLREDLISCALTIGLSADEAKKTVDSGIKSGREQVRELPERDRPVEVPEYRVLRPKEEDTEIPQDILNNIPNLLGSFCRYCDQTSMYKQPVLSLAAALPAIGTVMAHRVQGETGLRTNFFTLGIAKSGSGKEHARKCIHKIFQAGGLIDHIIGDPASATGLISSVHRANGQAMMCIDEFGRFLESLRGNNAASHLKMVTTNMMHMYNSSMSKFTGQEYADNGEKGGRSDIDQPCLGIYATTVPHRYYSALTNEEAYDGFLSRWLMFETNRFDIDPNDDYSPTTEVPADLVDALLFWKSHSKFNGSTASISIEPKTVPFSADARPLWQAYRRDCRARMAVSSDPVEQAFLNRNAEHAAKIALTGHRGASITSDVVEWAISLTEFLASETVRKVHTNMVRSEYERQTNEVRDFILAKKKGVSRSDIARRFRNLERKRRNDIVDTLVESGDIREEKFGEGDKKGTLFF